MPQYFGNCFPTRFFIPVEQLSLFLTGYDGSWRPYNIRKPHFSRQGLSLTSLDGELTGVPDLDSLLEYNRENGTTYRESSFKTPTPVLTGFKGFQQLRDAFGGHLSRSHLIKFGEGGFFPPHRDLFLNYTESFRLFAILSDVDVYNYHFVIDNKLHFFKPGQVYFVNTMLTHSFVSFKDKLTILVLNIDLNEQTLMILQSHLGST